jgi:hypothetical protein
MKCVSRELALWLADNGEQTHKAPKSLSTAQKAPGAKAPSGMDVTKQTAFSCEGPPSFVAVN